MRIKIISAITALCMSATVIGVALTANGKGNGVTPSQSQTTVTGGASSSTALNVIKYGDKLTQDQVMSQIKAQYLIENGGYKDTDEVVVMVAVDGESLIETFNGGKTETKSVSEYAESFAGEVQESDIVKKQNAVISALQASGLLPCQRVASRRRNDSYSRSRLQLRRRRTSRRDGSQSEKVITHRSVDAGQE